MPFDFNDPQTSTSPVGTSTRFLFDTKISDATFKELSDKLAKLHGKMKNLIDNATIDGQPVIKFVLQMSPDVSSEELDTLGRALQRIAQYLPVYKKLEEQVRFMEFARKNPDTVALAFGDFTGDVDDFIDEVRTPPT